MTDDLGTVGTQRHLVSCAAFILRYDDVMDIVIKQMPPGEAPEWVRQAWVGLRLPVAGSGPRKTITSGVLSGPSNAFQFLIALLTGQLNSSRGYAVYASEALAVLEQHRPDAAAWWRGNAPNVLTPRRRLLFKAECCIPATAGVD